MIEYISHSDKETREIAYLYGKNLKNNDIILLNGELGAGKTQFAKGIALSLGISELITSPTFTIMNVYKGGRLNLYHYDLYRIMSEDEMIELGLMENIDGVSVIEWNKFSDIKKAIIVNISIIDDNTRRIVIDESSNN